MSSVSHDKRNSEIIGPNDSVSSGNFDWVSTSPATSGCSLVDTPSFTPAIAHPCSSHQKLASSDRSGVRVSDVVGGNCITESSKQAKSFHSNSVVLADVSSGMSGNSKTNNLKAHVNDKTKFPAPASYKRKASEIEEDIYDQIGALDDPSFSSKLDTTFDAELEKATSPKPSGMSSPSLARGLTSIGYSSYAEFCASWEQAMYTPSDNGPDDPVLASLVSIPCLEPGHEDLSMLDIPQAESKGEQHLVRGLPEDFELEDPLKKKARKQGKITSEHAKKDAVGRAEKGIRKLSIHDVMPEITAGVEMKLDGYPFFA